MQRVDRWLGLGLALLGLAVMVSTQSFPKVPGQKLGAGFLPMLVGVGLLVCALLLIWRSRQAAAYATQGDAPRAAEHFGSSLVIIAAVGAYIGLVDWLGFLLLAPLCLIAVFRALRVGWLPALLWAVGGTWVVHVAFYKLLRVPLPWGVLRPLY